MKLLFPAFVMFALVSCKDSKTFKSGCYQYVSSTDTIQMELVIKGDAVSGTLNYKYAEKDQNTGSLSGIIEGNKLIADYTFQSEGTLSKRQVVFTKKGDQLIEGYGEIKDEGERVAFVNTSSLKFDEKFPLSPVDCAKKN